MVRCLEGLSTVFNRAGLHIEVVGGVNRILKDVVTELGCPGTLYLDG